MGAHGKVDPRIAGAKGGSAPRLPVNPRKLMQRIAQGGHGAAQLGLARDLGLLERQQPAPQPTAVSDPVAMLRGFDAAGILLPLLNELGHDVLEEGGDDAPAAA